MGAFAGGLTFRQYYLREPLPKDWKQRFQEGIESNTFKEIELQGEEDRAVGWCSVHFPLDLELSPEQYLYNEYLILGMRIDTLSVPGNLLRIFSESRARQIMMEQKRDSLTRFERAEIKEQVKRELRKRMMPSIKSVDMIWSWQQGILRFFNGNEKLNLEFMELFENSFGLQLIPDNAYTATLYAGMDLSDAERQALESVEPSSFVDQDVAVAAMTEV